MIKGCVGTSLKIGKAQFMISYDADKKTAMYTRTGADAKDITIKHDNESALREIMMTDYEWYVRNHPEITL